MRDISSFDLVLQEIADLFCKKMEFMKQFQVSVLHFDEHKVILQFDMQQALYGNMVHKILHGGVTATILDSAGGMAAMAATFAKDKDASVEVQLERVAKAATIDLRIDYLRPGRGETFTAEALILRCGNKITAVQSHLYNEKKVLLAIGMATYLIG